MSRRILSAIVVLVMWAAGMGVLVRREYFRPHIERLAEAALRVTPAAVFYAVLQGDKQVGFASSTIDTAATMIEQRDYLVADVMVGGRMHRTTARTTVALTRTLRVRTFDVSVETEQSPMSVHGEVLGDTLLKFVINAAPGENPDTQQTRINGPILLPTLVPLAVALENKPRVGRDYVLPVFDIVAMQPREVALSIQAESLFVVNDSSVFDSTASRWRQALPDTVRGWQIVAQSGSGIGGWVNEQGQLLATSQFGFSLERRPYEVAFENWRLDVEAAGAAATPARNASPNRDVLETTAIASNRRLRANLAALKVRLSGVSLRGFNLAGGRQTLRGDTVTVLREAPAAVAAGRYDLVSGDWRRRFPELQPEPFLEVDHPEIRALAARLAGRSRDRRTVAERLSRWVHDSLEKRVVVGIPSALHVLHTRVGDCNEHTQLFVALARAAGIPSRIASGLVYVDGKFYYHAWPEILLRGWIAIDPTFAQFPADASHIRFVSGGLSRQTELLRLINSLQVDVLTAR